MLIGIDTPSHLPIVGYAISEWEGNWRPRHEYMSQLASRGWPCVYTTGPLSLWDRNKLEWHRAPWLGSFRRHSHVIVDHAGRFPPRWPGHAIDAPVLRWHARRLRSALNASTANDLIAIVFDPVYWPHVATLAPRYLVYFQYDAYSKAPGWGADDAERERNICERADLIVSVTEGMAATLPGGAGERARILPNGVPLDPFVRAAERSCPPDLAAIPHPRLGHIGGISLRLNFDLMLAVMRSRPQWNLVLIGWVEREGGTGSLSDPIISEKWEKLRALPNVHYLPAKPHDEVPAYMAHMDLNALWYRTSGDGWWLVLSPIKLYENLAVGKPVVSTGLPAVVGYKEVVDIADTPDEWVSAIDHALTSGGVGTPERRREVAGQNTWNKRADRLEEWLLEMIWK